MPPRKSNPVDAAERQRAFRARKAEEGMVRHEIYLPEEAIEDEALIRERLGQERVRALVVWVLAQEARKLRKEDAPASSRARA